MKLVRIEQHNARHSCEYLWFVHSGKVISLVPALVTRTIRLGSACNKRKTTFSCPRITALWNAFLLFLSPSPGCLLLLPLSSTMGYLSTSLKQQSNNFIMSCIGCSYQCRVAVTILSIDVATFLFAKKDICQFCEQYLLQ